MGRSQRLIRNFSNTSAMSLKEVALLIIGITILLALPAAMVWSVVDHVKHGRKRERRGGSGGLASALQELDRLVTRPSVEHIVEAETRPLRREDDRGED